MDNKFYKIIGKRAIPGLSLHKTTYAVNSESPTHAHENARFVFVLQGAFTEEYERRKRECRSLTMIVRPPLEKHSENYHGKGIVCLSVDIQPQWINRLSRYDVQLNYSADFRSANLSSLILNLNNEFEAKDAASALAIEALLLEIAAQAVRQKEKNKSKDKIPNWLCVARDFIHAEQLSNLTISQIAAAANVHPVHLSRVFQRHFHCTIAEYIRRLRIETACLALTKSDESLVQIAVSSGFSDQSHFSKTFKRLMNVTPTKYRKLMRPR